LKPQKKLIAAQEEAHTQVTQQHQSILVPKTYKARCAHKHQPRAQWNRSIAVAIKYNHYRVVVLGCLSIGLSCFCIQLEMGN
jgi:hypothetical protein